jgi:hypothetical protein
MRDVYEIAKNTPGTPAEKADAMQKVLDELTKVRPDIRASRFDTEYGSGFMGGNGSVAMAGSDGMVYGGQVSGFMNQFNLTTGAKPPWQIPGICRAH